MRPLYIDGSPGCRVVLDEPALRVVVPDKADQLFPLSRISRVVCKGVVEWSMSALLACADADINLLFLEKNGEVRARWLGRGGERQSLTQRLVDLLARADGMERYENWYLSMQKLAARSFARRMDLVDWREVSINELRQRLPVQYSVFTVVMKRKALLRLLESINQLIHRVEDDIRCYRLPENTDIKTLGRQYFTEDVMLFTGGVNRLFGGQ